MVVGTWRTVCARGNPAVEAPILSRALEAGGGLLAPEFAGEAHLGTAAALSIAGLYKESEVHFEQSLQIYKASGDAAGFAWAQMNYATTNVRNRDPRLAMELCKEAAEMTSNWGVRAISLSHYSLGLAEVGEEAEALRVGEQVFAERLASKDATEEARAYGDLAELYIKVGRELAAIPLLRRGIDQLRQAGIQDMLFDAVMRLLRVSDDLKEVGELLKEAENLAAKIGSVSMQHEVALCAMRWAVQTGEMEAAVSATEKVFQLAKTMESPVALERSLRALSDQLKLQNRFEYANAILGSLGESPTGPIHVGWQKLLSSDSSITVGILAVVMAKEALLPES
jgi:tetratricopeptide (TPR) repeat protein